VEDSAGSALGICRRGQRRVLAQPAQQRRPHLPVRLLPTFDEHAMKLTGDLKSAKLIYLKGFLFLVVGLLSALGILLESPTLRTAFLLLIALWSFCRLYYFLFYVIEKYVDSEYKFAGLYSFLVYLLRKRRG